MVLVANDKDVMIVRQSSLKAAVEFITHCDKSAMSIDEVELLAEKFERWVLR
jgi:hypothetical protein